MTAFLVQIGIALGIIGAIAFYFYRAGKTAVRAANAEETIKAVEERNEIHNDLQKSDSASLDARLSKWVHKSWLLRPCIPDLRG